MSFQPFISVVVPTRNRLILLQQLLACIERQTYPVKRFEIIIVDDGSDDGSSDFLRQYVNLGNMRYIRQPSRGPAAARNTGAKEAHGEVLAFTDDDCSPEPDWLAELAKSYEARTGLPVDAVGGHIEIISHGHWLFHFYKLQGKRHNNNHAENPKYLDTANASFRRSTFMELGGFCEEYSFPSCEDMELGFRFHSRGYRLLINPDAVVWHTERASIKEMISQSYDRGRGLARLVVHYPEIITGFATSNPRLIIKCWLDKTLQIALRTPPPMRPFVGGITAAFRRAVYIIPEIEYFVHHYLLERIYRYRAANISISRLIFYFFLEWCDYLPRVVGQITGTYDVFYRRILSKIDVA